MSSIDLSAEILQRNNLPYYHDLPEVERRLLWEDAREHLAAEVDYFAGEKVYSTMRMVKEDVQRGGTGAGNRQDRAIWYRKSRKGTVSLAR